MAQGEQPTSATRAPFALLGPRRDLLPYVALSIVVSAPAWIVRHPPLQDMPFHYATLRVLRSFWSSEFGFSEHFRLSLGNTQYVLYYAVGVLLSLVVGVKGAHVALMALYLGGTPLALRSLLISLRKDPRLCLFVVPMLVNVMFVMGLLPNMLGYPLMFWALSAAVRFFDDPTRQRGVWLSVLSLGLFFMHLVPFLAFAIGCVALFPWRRPKDWVRAAAPLLPAVLATLWWLVLSRAGRAAAADRMDAPAALDHAIAYMLHWTGNVFQDGSDELSWILLALLAFAAAGLSERDPEPSSPALGKLWIAPALCIVLYFETGGTYGTIWPFSPRFLTTGLLLGIPFLKMPRGLSGKVVTALAAALGVASTVNTCRHFIQFEQREVGDFDRALAEIPPRSKVAGLVFNGGSAIIAKRFSPFVHFVNYYQGDKGGVVHFNYASYEHWPFRYRPEEPIPKAVLDLSRFPWEPGRVSPAMLAPYFDYVLVRGAWGAGSAPYHLKWRGQRWSVWEKG